MEELEWYLFENESQYDGVYDKLQEEVEKYAPRSNEPSASVPDAQAFSVFGRDDSDATQGPSFWSQKFGEATEVSWTEFEAALESFLSSLIEENMRPFVINTVRNQMFAGADVISLDNFKSACPPGKDFGKIAIRMAMEQWTIQEVFSMDSTVRLTSIENLSKWELCVCAVIGIFVRYVEPQLLTGKIKSPAVVEALVKLLDSDDPNVRAVAAISLGRAEKADEKSIDRLLLLLEDKDRIVRQSACLSLGRLKVSKAVPKISHIW